MIGSGYQVTVNIVGSFPDFLMNAGQVSHRTVAQNVGKGFYGIVPDDGVLRGPYRDSSRFPSVE